MKGLWRLLLIVLCSAVVTRGGELATFQPQDPGAEDPEYFPVPAVGAVMEFSATVASGGKNGKGTAKLTVEKEEEIKGHKYLKRVDEAVIQGRFHKVTYIRYAEDGIHTIEGESKDAPDYVNPPFPLSLGKEWTYVHPMMNVTMRCKAEAIEDVKIGGQIYKDCLRLSETMDTGNGFKTVQETWYAPKVGIVKVTVKNGSVTEAQFLLTKPATAAK